MLLQDVERVDEKRLPLRFNSLVINRKVSSYSFPYDAFRCDARG